MADPDDLYQQFIEVHQQRGFDKDENSTLDSAQEFECLTDAHLQVLLNLRAKRTLTEDDSNLFKKLEVMLKEERNTWRLAKALLKDQLLTGQPTAKKSTSPLIAATTTLMNADSFDVSRGSDRMDDSGGDGLQQNGHQHDNHVRFSEEQIIGNFYVANEEIRRMQLVTDWLEANEANDLDYKDEEDKVEFYTEGPTAWENTFHAIRAKYNIDIPDLDITINPNAGIELCSAMDPDAPIRTKKSLVHSDKEIEIRLFKHLFRFIRAGKLDEGQELAQRVGYHWLSAILDGWLPLSDPNLDQENLGTTAIHQPSEIRPVSGNKKRDIWKQTCFKSAKMHGLTSCEKAILGVLGGNLKSVLPVCHNWADQLWARLKCSIDVKIEEALRDPNIALQDNRSLIDMPQEFYDNYQSLDDIFRSMREHKVVSPYKEATIHQAVQKHFILNDIDGLLNQLSEWCSTLDFDNNEGSMSPQFLRFFAHIVLFLREINLVNEDDSRGTKIIESYIALLTQQKSIESVAHYSVFLPKENQTLSFAKLLATIGDKEERRQCLRVAKESKLDVDEITQTVVEIIRDEAPGTKTGGFISSADTTKTTQSDKRKIDALDYLLLLDSKNYMAILHHGNILMRHFALQKKMEAVKDTFLKLPVSLRKSVENQWKVHTNSDITPSLNNNLRELDGFRALLEAQEELSQWSEWHHKKPEPPKKPANLSKFCDNVNYEQRLKQYEQDLSVWKGLQEARTDSLTNKIREMFYFHGGWMKDIPDETTTQRQEQLKELRLRFVPHLVTISFNILNLTGRFDDCLNICHMMVDEKIQLYKDFSKTQLRELLDKVVSVCLQLKAVYMSN